jgi:uncharacterized membrane protein YbhN (UPF0104 family)
MMRSTGRRSVAATGAGALAVAGILAWALSGKRDEFAAALGSAPVWVLLLATALQVLALVSRSEAWHASVTAAGGTVSRRRLHRAASTGNLASVVNSHLGTAARIAVLRRTAPADAPRVPALIAAEVPILTVEAALAALASFTLVGPLGLPWWLPLLFLAAAGCVIAGLGRLAGSRRRECWRGLAVLRSLQGRNRVLLLVLVAVLAQIMRNWLMLHAVGVDASVLDATAVLIAMVTLSQLPVGPSVGAAAVVLILGANGVALAAAAGVLLTVTGTAGALCFAAWAAVDHLRARVPALPGPPVPATGP